MPGTTDPDPACSENRDGGELLGGHGSADDARDDEQVDTPANDEAGPGDSPRLDVDQMRQPGLSLGEPPETCPNGGRRHKGPHATDSSRHPGRRVPVCVEPGSSPPGVKHLAGRFVDRRSRGRTRRWAKTSGHACRKADGSKRCRREELW